MITTLAIAVVATESHTYTMHAQARAVQTCLAYDGTDPDDVVFILVGDTSKSFKDVAEYYRWLFPNANVQVSTHKELKEGERRYTTADQLLIAQMRTRAVEIARRERVDALWFLDSDVLPVQNALRASIDMLSFDKGNAYQVAACPYPSQGGGPWLCGRGTYQNWISIDVLTEEHALPDKVRKRINDLKERRDAARDAHDMEGFVQAATTLNQIATQVPRRYPPAADQWGINANGNWRKRGWFTWAYPGIGWGAVVPSDWCGLGCTLISKRALDLTDWIGYSGGGTEDLFLCWEKWWRNGIKIAAIPHSACHHVIRVRGEGEKYVIVESYHEAEGEYVYHLRQRTRPFYQHSIGEQFDERNDGRITHHEKTVNEAPKHVRFMEMGQPPDLVKPRKRKRIPVAKEGGDQ